MKKISIDQLKQNAANRPEGYFEDVVSRGNINGDILSLDDGIYIELIKKYSNARQPTVSEKATNAIGAIGRVTKAAFKREQIRVSNYEWGRRMSVCQSCELFTGKTCLKCGCIIKFKTMLETEKCPIGKW